MFFNQTEKIFRKNGKEFLKLSKVVGDWWTSFRSYCKNFHNKNIKIKNHLYQYREPLKTNNSVQKINKTLTSILIDFIVFNVIVFL